MSNKTADIKIIISMLTRNVVFSTPQCRFFNDPMKCKVTLSQDGDTYITAPLSHPRGHSLLALTTLTIDYH